jgi:catechol 2,3-dioxygenase-like lactoylglutathione lyase family enzyme
VLDHVSLQSTVPARAVAFYDEVLLPLGIVRVMEVDDAIGYGSDGRPDFWIGLRAAGGPSREVHVSFRAPSHDAVEAFHRAAAARGAEVLHAPRLWPEYHAAHFAAFVRDPDGNNVEAVCHG